MKKIDWLKVATEIKIKYPHILQIATYNDDNLVIVFEEEPSNFLVTYYPLSQIIHKYKLPTPLLISKEFIDSSLDSYPLEFLDIQSSYKNFSELNKVDYIQNLHFNKQDVRLQVERELKSKWLLTRLSSLNYLAQRKRLFLLLKQSVHALLPVFKGFLFLKDIPIPKTNTQILEELANALQIEIKALRYIINTTACPSIELMRNLFSDYLRTIKQCIDLIDNWKA